MTYALKIYTGRVSPTKYIRLIQELNIGVMVEPKHRHPYLKYPFFAVDNGAYIAYKNEVPWDEEGFIKLLEDIKSNYVKPDFVVIPDKVADKETTLKLAEAWIPILKKYNWPLYLALQDGMIPNDTVPFHNHIEGFFLGGTMKWKEETLPMWAGYAQGCKLKLHVGRYGTEKRLNHAEAYKVDSVDSANFIRNKTFNSIINSRAQQRLKEEDQ